MMLLFPDDTVCVTTGDDRRLQGILQPIFIALCDLGVAFIFFLFLFFLILIFSFDHEF